MTPERAAYHLADESGKHGGPVSSIIAAVLAACAEQDKESRYAALTEAAEACRSLIRSTSPAYIRDDDDACRDCADTIERIRDKK